MTVLPIGNTALQLVPQLMPAGLLVTAPVPGPPVISDSVPAEATLKVALTVRAAVMLTTQVLALPVHAPVQPANTEPGTVGAAFSVTDTPELKLAMQVAPPFGHFVLQKR